MANIAPIMTRKTAADIPSIAPDDIDEEEWTEEDEDGEDEASVWVGAELDVRVSVGIPGTSGLPTAAVAAGPAEPSIKLLPNWTPDAVAPPEKLPTSGTVTVLDACRLIT
jgi:hypothetical protein